MSQPDVPPSAPQRPSAADECKAVEDNVSEAAAFSSEKTADGSREIEQLEAELQQAQTQILRAQADLENFRKRVRRDLAEERKYACLPLVQDLLPIADGLDLALQAIQPDDAGAGIAAGVRMVCGQLASVLQQHHCQPIAAEGQVFDPHLHEAVAQLPDAQHPRGTVIQMLKPGYRLHDRVVRPAQVIISAGPADEQQGSTAP